MTTYQTDLTHQIQLADEKREAIVSTSAYGMGISEDTRQKILDLMTQVPAKPQPTGQLMRAPSRNISLVVPGLHTADYVGLVTQGIFKSSQILGYNIILHVQNSALQTHDTNYFRSLIANSMTDGFLLIVPHYFDVFTHLCCEYNLPCVAVDDAGVIHESIPTITSTDYQGMYEAVQHLISLGHQRIGFITGLMHVHSARERLRGYRDALDHASLPYDPALIREGDWSRPMGVALTQQLLALDAPPTAIAASNDLMAFGAMDAAKDASLVIGSDFSVTGFDDIPEAATSLPPLTSVRQPMELMGQAAIEMLIDMIEGQTPSPQREFKTQLIMRQSTGPLKV
jgi:LacI family transcriptional regulator